LVILAPHRHKKLKRTIVSKTLTLSTMNTPAATTNAAPATITIKPRRSKRQQDATFGTRRSQRALKRRHAGNDSRIYGDDYGILPSD